MFQIIEFGWAFLFEIVVYLWFMAKFNPIVAYSSV